MCIWIIMNHYYVTERNSNQKFSFRNVYKISSLQSTKDRINYFLLGCASQRGGKVSSMEGEGREMRIRSSLHSNLTLRFEGE